MRLSRPLCAFLLLFVLACYRVPVTTDTPIDEYSTLEFDDNGFLRSPKKWSGLLKRLDEQAEKEVPLAVVVFVHGWNHNAAPNDSDLVKFRQTVGQIAKEHPKASIFPVYLAWRGRSLPWKLNYATFWARKAAAERVGRGDFSVVLQTLISRRQKWQSRSEVSQLVVVGHSFGGAAVLSALLPQLASDLQGSDFARSPDLVVALNPAIEHRVLSTTVLSDARIDTLRQEFTKRLVAQSVRTPTRLVILDAENDFPRHWLFRIGRRVGATWGGGVVGALVAAPLSSGVLVPSLAAAGGMLAMTAVRPLLGLRVHEDYTSAGRYTPRPYLKGSVEDISSAEPSCLSFALPSQPGKALLIRPGKDGSEFMCDTPVKIIRVTDDIVDGHNGIWKQSNVALLRALIEKNMEQLRSTKPRAK